MDEEDIRRIEGIEGQIAAIGMTLNAIISVHHNQAALHDAIRASFEKMQARLLPTHVPDDVIEGARRFVAQRIQRQGASSDPGT